MSACAACLRRAALLARLSAHVEVAWRSGRGPGDLLVLPERALLASLGAAPALARTVPEAEEVAAVVAAAGLGSRCAHRGGLPERLTALADPPAALFVDDPGALLDRAAPAVAVVGARRASEDALAVARELGAGLAEAGATVVSGMALGVDSAAHEGALAVGGPTVAVLPGGADVAAPASRARLHRRLRREGAVVAELPPGTPPRRWTFPARNRIIAGLADVVVVVEAAARSGSLITARRALELGRDVAAVPGPVRGGRADGTNALLKDGAHVVRGPDDARDLVGLAAPRAAPRAGRRPAAADPPAGAGGRLLHRARDGARTLDELLADDDPGTALVALDELEACGRLRRLPDGRYASSAG